MSRVTHNPVRLSKGTSPQVDNPLPFAPTSSKASTANDLESPKLIATATDTANTSLFRCSQCPRAFTRRENLARHAKSHNILRTHQCRVCGKGFTRSDLLRRHEAGHARWDKQAEMRQSSNISKRRKLEAAKMNNFSSPQSLLPSNDQHPSSYYERTEGMIESLTGAELLDDGYGGRKDSSHGFDTPTRYETATGSWNTDDQNERGIYQSNSAGLDVTLPHNHYQLGLNTTLNGGGYIPDTESSSLLPFDSVDFSSFFLNPGHNNPMDVSNEWFSNDFYSAMREVDNNYEQMETIIGTNFASSDLENHFSILSHQPGDTIPRLESNINPHIDARFGSDHAFEGSASHDPDLERKIRLSSPPNELSEEDKWPFAWNPRSREILLAEPVSIPVEHPYWKSHNHRFDICESTLLRLKAFLRAPAGRELHMSQRATVQLPSLPEINIFIGLFFERFSLQMPVLHHATVDTNVDLPPPLLAIMIVIGATYSRVKHTRRFSIVLLDIVRWHLQIAIECDNSLMREPMIIFAEALICHAGLWCGNKRAFELAEIVRAVVVKHIRTLRFRAGGPQVQEQGGSAQPGNTRGASTARWRQWIESESQRRLYWVIYTIDCQFSSLLNLPPTIAIGEIRNLGCPCDDEFWLATSARNWRNLLGPAVVPPSRVFSAAAAPFITTLSSPEEQSFNVHRLNNNGIAHGSEQLPVLDLNAWSAFLVLITIQCLIFQFEQDSIFIDSVLSNSDEIDEDKDDHHAQSASNYENGEPELNALEKWQKWKRDQLSTSLSRWIAAYQSPRVNKKSQSSSNYFHKSSLVLHRLALITLSVPLSYLQNSIGKEGKEGILQAMSSLRYLTSRSRRRSEETVYDALTTIVSLSPKKDTPSAHSLNPIDTEPYSIITLFLSHIVFWIHLTVSNHDQKNQLLARMAKNESLVASPLYALLNSALEPEGQRHDSDLQQDAEKMRQRLQRTVFKSAAEVLTRLGTWGASLNLALMLYRRAEM